MARRAAAGLARELAAASGDTALYFMTSLSGVVRRLEDLGVDRSPDCNDYLQALRDLAGFELNVVGTAEDALKHAQRALEIEQERGLQRSWHHGLGHEMLARIKMKLNFDRKSVLHHARSAVKIVETTNKKHMDTFFATLAEAQHYKPSSDGSAVRKDKHKGNGLNLCWRPQCDSVEERRGEFRKCARCMQAVYCSKECQKQHYKVHKKECAKMVASS